jgi:nitrile hydratase beta subunit
VNSIHDMGGMSGFGPVRPVPQDDPPFHAPWEATVYAINRILSAQGLYCTDELRYAVESLDPVTYVGSSYFTRWLAAQERLLLQKGVLREGEVAERTAAVADGSVAPSRHEDPRLLALMANPSRRSEARPAASEPRFHAGDRVRTRNMHPRGHTRLPRYARDKEGVVERLWGTFVFPDTNAHGLGENPQPLYCVVFDSRELWGEDAEPNQRVSLDLFESYLLPA